MVQQYCGGFCPFVLSPVLYIQFLGSPQTKCGSVGPRTLSHKWPTWLCPMGPGLCTHSLIESIASPRSGYTRHPHHMKVGKETLREVGCLRSPQGVVQRTVGPELSHSDPVLFSCPSQRCPLLQEGPRPHIPWALSPDPLAGAGGCRYSPSSLQSQQSFILELLVTSSWSPP